MRTGLKRLLQLKHPITTFRVLSHLLLGNTFISFFLLHHVHFAKKPSLFHWTPWYNRMISNVRQNWAQNRPSSYSLAGWSWANLCFLICEIRILEPGSNKLNNLKKGQSDSLLIGLVSGNTITTSATNPCVAVHTELAWHKLLTLMKMCGNDYQVALLLSFLKFQNVCIKQAFINCLLSTHNTKINKN